MFSRVFGKLNARYKLIILHNLFFVALVGLVWFTLIPLIEDGVGSAQERELGLIRQLIAVSGSLADVPGLNAYQYREGPAADLGIPPELLPEVEANPNRIYEDLQRPGVLFSKDAGSGLYRSIQLPDDPYRSLVMRSKITLFFTMGILYVIAVLILEFAVMRLFIYQPIATLLAVDEATRRGDTKHELVRESQIPADELGQVMRSRNATITKLRAREDDLHRTLKKLEEVAADLRQKNHLLETAKQNIVDQDRLASIGLLSASVAHELNTPLAVLHGSIEKMLEQTKDPTTRERLERMQRVTERLKNMGADLLDFARERSPMVEPVAVQTVIDESWHLVAIDDKSAGVAFSNQTNTDDLALANPDRLVQLFVNLLRNALNATPPGGHIQVRSWKEEGGSESPAQFICVATEDDGPGIPSDVLPEVFEAFVTTRLDSRGTGLGLTVAEGIAHQHGGSITASNRPEGGACLTVRLPSASDSASRNTADRVPVTPDEEHS
jgi:signal transduction histidine kinase